MDNKSFNIRVPKRVAMILAGAVLIVAPLTAYAGHIFNDVPDSHTFHDNITWLAESEVTRGCNPPENTEFCPDDNVTRGQMAAFMQRFAQYIDAEDGTPGQADNATTADNATNLGGEVPDAYRTIVQADGCIFADCTDHTANVSLRLYGTVEVNAPADGVLEISSSWHGFSDGNPSNFVQLWAAVDKTSNDGCGDWGLAPLEAAEGSYAATTIATSVAGAVSTTTAVEIPAGTHTVKLCSLSDGGSTTETATITTEWTQGGEGLSSSVTVSEAELERLAAEFDGEDLSHIEN